MLNCEYLHLLKCVDSETQFLTSSVVPSISVIYLSSGSRMVALLSVEGTVSSSLVFPTPKLRTNLQ